MSKQTNIKSINITGSVSGLATLVVIISATYAIVTIVAGTDGLVPKMMVAPLGVWAALETVKRFVK